MKTFFGGILMATLFCGLSFAQNPTPGPQNSTPAPTTGASPQAQPSPAPAQPAPSGATAASPTPRIAPGSVIPVQLTKSIDAKKVKTGDEVEARVTQDMKAANGEVIVPKDTKVVGKVTEAQARNKEQKESQVAITFDRAVMKTGGDLNVPMSIQAIIAPSYLSGGNNSGAGEGAGQAPAPASPGGGVSPGNAGGRSAGMGTSQASAPAAPSAEGSGGTQNGKSAREPITGNTQGVLGMPNMKLSTTAGTPKSSVVSSEKDNVKLESGTLMLLRVNQ